MGIPGAPSTDRIDAVGRLDVPASRPDTRQASLPDPQRGFPRIICSSLPKAGTHMVSEHCACIPGCIGGSGQDRAGDGTLGRIGRHARTAQAGGAVGGASPVRPGYLPLKESRGVRGIYTVRDPRDVVLSQVHFIVKRRLHPHHAYFAAKESLSERLELAILGMPRQGSLRSANDSNSTRVARRRMSRRPVRRSLDRTRTSNMRRWVPSKAGMSRP